MARFKIASMPLLLVMASIFASCCSATTPSKVPPQWVVQPSRMAMGARIADKFCVVRQFAHQTRRQQWRGLAGERERETRHALPSWCAAAGQTTA
eukprot:13144-Rhodomonas_salina.5